MRNGKSPARSFLLILMSQQRPYNSHSPPPLRHPVPTHPAYIPEPPPTPQAYQRFSSSPAPGAGAGTVPPSVPPTVQAYPVPQPQRAQAYTSPFQHSQMGGGGAQYGVGPGMQQHQQQTGGEYAAGAAGGSPDFRAWGFDGATAQLGMQLGHSAVAAGQDYVQKNVRFLFYSCGLNFTPPPPGIVWDAAYDAARQASL
jgi:hypothetical protein